VALIGYGRVSTQDQNPNSQHDALQAAGCTRIFIDKASGKLASRPELDKALDYARPGDTLVITRLSRIARSLKNLLELSETLEKRDIGLKALKQDIDTTTPTGRLIFRIFGAIDEFQRDLIVEGTLEGLESARARGRVGGRPAALTETQIRLARQMYDERGDDEKRRYTVQEIANTFGVGRATIYRHLNPDKESTP
jgi:DNA invertase Pin-like site-specific DNA recombinase